MSKATLRRYQFATQAQWKSCLFAQADGELLSQSHSVGPLAPYDRSSQLHKSDGASAPAITPAGVIFWHDTAGCLERLSPCCDRTDTNADYTAELEYDAEPERLSAPSAIAVATRLISTTKDLWVIGDAPNVLNCYDQETLALLLTVELPNSRIADLLRGKQETVFAVVESDDDRKNAWQVVQVDCTGRIVSKVALRGFTNAKAFVYLQRSGQLVVLTDEKYPRLCWFSEQGGAPESSVAIGALHPCFTADVLACDFRDRLYVAGADGQEFGGRAYVLVLDQDGNQLDQIPIDAQDAPISGIAAGHENLLITGPRGLLQFRAADAVPDAGGDVLCTLVTPMLNSPEHPDVRGWLRAEVAATLPEGTTLEVAVAATSDLALRDRLNGIANDEGLSETNRIRRLLNQPGVWRPATVFQGLDPNQSDATYSVPLFDIREPYVWVSITLSAAPRAKLPTISRLAVLYPNVSLIDDLPAIYRRFEGQPTFVRSLVGVLEATTQDLDARISAMGSLVNPSTAPVEWLDFTARWLGLPWDDALSTEQKRCLLLHASNLARQRGTRAGLETLLACLIPDMPQRFRITDTTADYGFAIVGDVTCPGSSLPAMLGGFTRWNAALDERSVLGYMRLPCPNQAEDPARWWAGKVRVEIAASAEERKAWSPWFARLISEMMPLTARLNLDWVSPYALRSDTLDGTLVLEPTPIAHLGTDAITGLARLPEGDTRISTCGRTIGTRLH